VNELKCLIISSSIDYSTDLICAELEKRNAQYLRLNRDQLSVFQIEYNVDENQLYIGINGKRYVFRNRIENSIYFRAPVFMRTMNKRLTLDEQVYKSQWSSFLRNLISFYNVK
jgi:hypothetical protein